MSDSAPIQTIKAVSDWSKWVTGLSVFSFTGCATVLLTKGVGKANIINIKLAIGFFLLTILISWLIQVLAADLRQYLAGRNDTGNTIKIFSATTAHTWFRRLVFTEIVCFLLALVFLFIWIWNIPAKV